ncbi:hypothetical protein MNB_SV-14-386 [hydrothermal vent metagenome]|uniref:Uncharacterized protein n=1 Tax=hydrothermal vent metagenome TaxID=652676 RepID=A0A1W1CE98_9ZZZZ
MDNKNYEAYINILSNDIKTQKEDEALTLFVTDEALKKLKKIKNFMEWKTDLALNSIFTFFFKTKNVQTNKSIKLDSNKKQIEIKFTPTIKNEERINKYLKDNSSIIEASIDVFYKHLIGSNSK